MQPGDALPAVVLPSTAGREVDLAAEAAGGHLVLFFYPGDREGLRYPEMAGCTPEACAFRDALATLRGLGASVFGVNLHTTERQRQFVAREHLTFELLSDEEQRLVGALGIPLWVADTGEEFVARTTLVVARGGRVAAVYEHVQVEGHVEAVIAAVRRLAA